MKKLGVACPHERFPYGFIDSHPAGTAPDILDVVSLILDAIVKQQNKGGLA
jgi:hypothetical protein